MPGSKPGIRVLLPKVLGITFSGRAGATISVGVTVKPFHVSGHVIPEGNHQSHATLHSLSKLLQAPITPSTP
jgi:hypothetical protein